ncbi:MAG: dynamin family protein [Solirubrobacterales bacterium]|nr:dynamin family protein [Solirubrobacterales bacterium]
MSAVAARMAEVTPLFERARSVIDDGLAATAGINALTRFHTALADVRRSLGRPMSVAVVGRIKAGKSSAVNALLGDELLATGKEELTYNVNVLRHGESAGLRVHFKDGEPPAAYDFAELDCLSTRSNEHREILNRISYIEVFSRNPLLEQFDLVDTPGLDSSFVEDSDNTRRWLRLEPSEIYRMSEEELRGADAVLYLFRYSVAASDDVIMREFHGMGMEHASPLNAIGVLTRGDENWVPGGEDPMEEAGRVAERLSAESRRSNIFFTVIPISAKLGLAARRLGEDAHAALGSLGNRFARHRILDELTDARKFLAEDGNGARRALWDELGRYGIWLAWQRVAEGGTLADVRAALHDVSGLDRLSRLLTSHFGARASLIKVAGSVRRGRAACSEHLPTLAGEKAQLVRTIREELEAIETEEPAFRLLQVLYDYYDGSIGFTPDEEEQLKQATGEYGSALDARLGLKLDFRQLLDTAEQRARERVWHWRQRATAGGSDNDASAARELALAYDDLIEEVRRLRLLILGANGSEGTLGE